MQFMDPKDVRQAVEAKGTKFATVTFVKKDGSVRTKNGLFKPLKHIKGVGRKMPEGYIPIWSPHEDGPDPRDGKWGMFHVEKVLEVK